MPLRWTYCDEQHVIDLRRTGADMCGDSVNSAAGVVLPGDVDGRSSFLSSKLFTHGNIQCVLICCETNVVWRLLETLHI